MTTTLASIAKPLDPAEVDEQLRVLRAIWVLVSARVRDDLGRQVAELGEKLQAARDAEDWQACREVLDDVRQWLATMAGVVTSRMTRVFDA